MTVDSAPLTLQIELRVRGSKDGALRDGDTVTKGDRIQVFVQTTEDAHLYLAYCTEKRELAVFPLHGSIFTAAGEPTVAPGKETALLIDDHGGAEALYVILSRADLASVDPRLAEAIKAAQPGEPAADCGPRFQVAVKPPAPPEPVAGSGRAPASPDSSTRLRPGDVGDGSLAPSSAPRYNTRADARKPPQVSQGRPSSIGSGATPDANPGPGTPWTRRLSDGGITSEKSSSPNIGAPAEPFLRGRNSADDDEQPLVTIERGMRVSQNGIAEVTANADANGIAILHYRFKHVAALRP